MHVDENGKELPQPSGKKQKSEKVFVYKKNDRDPLLK